MFISFQVKFRCLSCQTEFIQIHVLYNKTSGKLLGHSSPVNCVGVMGGTDKQDIDLIIGGAQARNFTQLSLLIFVLYFHSFETSYNDVIIFIIKSYVSRQETPKLGSDCL